MAAQLVAVFWGWAGSLNGFGLLGVLHDGTVLCCAVQSNQSVGNGAEAESRVRGDRVDHCQPDRIAICSRAYSIVSARGHECEREVCGVCVGVCVCVVSVSKCESECECEVARAACSVCGVSGRARVADAQPGDETATERVGEGSMVVAVVLVAFDRRQIRRANERQLPHKVVSLLSYR